MYSLESKTEGWIAGLQLTALSMQGRDDVSKFIQDLKGDNRYIMDYLLEEVLKIQSDEVNGFLLKTSILKQMSAPLCNALLNRNDSQLMLETLEQNNMFVIPLDNDRNWYRYHHLFADLLKQRLQLQDKEAITELHNKACKWFEQHAMFDFAIEHALAIAYNSKGYGLNSYEAFQKAYEYAINSGNVYLISTLILRMADIEQQQGHYRSAYEKCSEVLTLMREKGYEEITKLDWTYVIIYVTMAFTEYMWAEIDKAYENIKVLHSLCKGESDIMLKISVIMIYSSVLYERGDIQGCENEMREADQILKKNKVPPYFSNMFIAMKLSFMIKLKQFDKANKFIMDSHLAIENEISFANETAYMVFARKLLAEYKFTEAETVLSKLYTIINIGKRTEQPSTKSISQSGFHITQGSGPPIWKQKQPFMDDLLDSLRWSECSVLCRRF